MIARDFSEERGGRCGDRDQYDRGRGGEHAEGHFRNGGGRMVVMAR